MSWVELGCDKIDEETPDHNMNNMACEPDHNMANKRFAEAEVW